MSAASLARYFAGCLLLALDCSDVGPRVYIAEPYDAEGECLGEYEAIGLVQADRLPSDCRTTCLEVRGTLYVSSVCPPFPDGATELTSDDPACAAALTAEPCLSEASSAEVESE